MSEENKRKVNNVEISNKCWKELQKIRIDLEVSFPELISLVLEKLVKNKKLLKELELQNTTEDTNNVNYV